MNIDDVIDWVIIPILKYPILLFLPFMRFYDNLPLYMNLLLYSIIIRFGGIINTWTKLRGERWYRFNEMQNLKILITGGSNGLGETIMKKVLERADNVTIINIDIVPSKLEDPRIVNYVCDLTNEVAVQETLDNIKMEQCTENSGINVIINNAGMRSKYRFLDDVDLESIKNILQINTMVPLKIVKEFSPVNKPDQQCYIINIASTLGILGPAKVAGYAASKAALISLHESYQNEMEIKKITNIRSLLVIPGQLNTQMFTGFEPPKQFFAPVINVERLSEVIITKCENGERGKLCAPYYSNFAHILMSLPFGLQVFVRKFSGMDACLPDE
ncbi:hypothetical protein Kpol_1014p2 [Vanderwaltozyma polyspora DSM 70294]|uniref:Uncharacterized protein n=1 Tax=Vanderwaltozyma polyspora (strain ATCC 22028 / DSM 70294 / BCRC 21397 / CBS 2163 / NBRC 10782 / NRRL Y-8283 / UCD 57-17) TaxID=436907 RepID=A7TND4_VANPO|nr:uncharacterized protein Kpol_1014p2 [Vanderwaltozyma polyspora DSM 70294]EDO16187.1 hypothetical protein Kpol_1014p2 [Vanderwaltozyma polyspora DSM 70294]